MAADPIHQFRIIDLFPVAKVGHTEIAFTNSAAFMLVAVVGITAFLVIVPCSVFDHAGVMLWGPSLRSRRTDFWFTVEFGNAGV
jgi:hypothetical protein